ncbi:MAG: type I restriction enzyme HsdR N-terminal domain-containing protein [Flavobacteriaceae bacterium]
MLKLNFPAFKILIKNKDNKSHIFDVLRKKFVVLTPEEWVRQHVVNFLIKKNISKNHIAIEKRILINNLTKRFDVLVYDRNGEVLLLIECKAPKVNLNQKVFDQVSIYNQHLNSKFLMITNGLSHFYLKVDKKNKKYVFLNKFPL